MSVSETSKEAYSAIYDKLGERQTQVYEALKAMGTATNEELADYLNWPINRITGRTSELKSYDMIVVVGIGVNKSGFSAKKYAIRDLNDRNLKDMVYDCE